MTSEAFVTPCSTQLLEDPKRAFLVAPTYTPTVVWLVGWLATWPSPPDHCASSDHQGRPTGSTPEKSPAGCCRCSANPVNLTCAAHATFLFQFLLTAWHMVRDSASSVVRPAAPRLGFHTTRPPRRCSHPAACSAYSCMPAGAGCRRELPSQQVSTDR